MKCAALTSFFRVNRRFIVKDHIGQLFNLAGYVAWAWALLADGRMLQLHAFRGFSAPAWAYGLLFLILIALTIVGLLQNCRHIAAIGMMLGATAWSLISVEFWYSYPPWTPQMLVYPAVAALDYLLALDLEKEAACMEQ